MAKTYYVYMLHESPIERPYYCKVGFSHDPLRRLDQLQAGNPRALRCWEYMRRPTKPFGFRLPDKGHAVRFERQIHDRLTGMGLRLRRDLNYETDDAPEREWFAELHPEKLYLLMLEMYAAYVKENAIDLSV